MKHIMKTFFSLILLTSLTLSCASKENKTDAISTKKNCSKLVNDLYGDMDGFNLGKARNFNATEIKLALGIYSETAKSVVVVNYTTSTGDHECTCVYDNKKKLLNPDGEIYYGNSGGSKSYKTLFFKFHDASLPPEYHRSYGLKITGDVGQYYVTSYNDTLDQQTIKVGAYQLKELSTLAKNMKGIKRLDFDDKSGSTAEQIYLVDMGGNETEAFWNNDAHSTVEDFIAYFKKIFAETGIRLGAAEKN